jgi:hypothetical protein
LPPRTQSRTQCPIVNARTCQKSVKPLPGSFQARQERSKGFTTLTRWHIRVTSNASHLGPRTWNSVTQHDLEAHAKNLRTRMHPLTKKIRKPSGQDHRHRLGMDGADESVRLGRQKAEGGQGQAQEGGAAAGHGGKSARELLHVGRNLGLFQVFLQEPARAFAQFAVFIPSPFRNRSCDVFRHIAR